MYVAFVNAFARIIYTIMYVKCGSGSRVIGVIASGPPLNLLAIAGLVFIIIELAQ